MMKTAGVFSSLPIAADDGLLDMDLPVPEIGSSDLRVAIEAISVNPTDAKPRIRTTVDTPHPDPFILGYKAVGTVDAVGSEVSGFKVGDRVWYAGDVNRPGSYGGLQAVDHRIASHAPTSIDPPEAGALPLASRTAWEMLFDRLQVRNDTDPARLLIIGGAGGVGTITTQPAGALTSREVIATASRPETATWCRDMGAHHIETRAMIGTLVVDIRP